MEPLEIVQTEEVSCMVFKGVGDTVEVTTHRSHTPLTIAQVYLLAAWLDGWITEHGVRAPKKEK